MKEGEDVGLNGDSEWNESESDRKRRETVAASAFTEIGTGIMPIQEIIDAANNYTDSKYIILEQDFTQMSSEIESIRKKHGGIPKIFRYFMG